MNIGLIGYGELTRDAHAIHLDALEDVNITAIGDPSDTAQTFAKQAYPSATIVESAEQVLAMPDVDAVVIALPMQYHAQTVKSAFEAGKHVYVEKPLATTIEDAEAVEAAWRASGKIGIIGHSFRHNIQFVEARQKLQSGAIGDIRYVHTNFSSTLDPLPTWKSNVSAGIVFDFGSHVIDFIMFMTGANIIYVNAIQSADGKSADLQFKLDNDTFAHMTVSWNSVVDHDMVFYGSDGTLRLNRYNFVEPLQSSKHPSGFAGYWLNTVLQLRKISRALDRRKSHFGEPAYRISLERFVESVRTGQVPSESATIADGVRGVRVMVSAQQSIETNSPQHIVSKYRT